MFELQINLTVITICNKYSLLEQQQYPNPVITKNYIYLKYVLYVLSKFYWNNRY